MSRLYGRGTRWFTVSEYAKREGLTTDRVRRMCRSGELRCKRDGDRWWVWSEVVPSPSSGRI